MSNGRRENMRTYRVTVGDGGQVAQEGLRAHTSHTHTYTLHQLCVAPEQHTHRRRLTSCVQQSWASFAASSGRCAALSINSTAS